MKYDLEERVAKFGEDIIVFLKKVPTDAINTILVKQLVPSATSIGANYMEANEASSKKDFRNKVCICKKEANESKHWLRMLAKANPDQVKICRDFWQEAHELTLIFATIAKKIDLTKN